MPTINPSLYPAIKNLYESGETMATIAKNLNVSVDALTYAIRRMNIPRRSIQKVNALRFAKKAPSFKITLTKTPAEKTIETLGLALYWAEGYKTEKSHGVDFANSDPIMISAFMKFLRTCYNLDKKRLRVLLYCYNDQDTAELIHYWSNLTKIHPSQFSKPYIRENPRQNGRKMKYGLIHIRYADKKLLYDILSRINRLKSTV